MTLPPALDLLETPFALVDLGRTRRNAARVADYCHAHGLAWRPHIKTHKSSRVARIQLEAGAAGVTVATLREAEVMSTLCDDVLVAYPVLGDAKLARLTSLPESVRLPVALDSDVALAELSRAAASAGRTVHVLVEADVGLRRVGVEAPEEAVRLARIATELPGVAYDGLMFYPGHIRVPRDRQDESLAALGARLSAVLEALEAAGLPARVVSGGSTPTLWNSHRVQGLTEIRAGSCIFNDLESVALGSASWDDLAYTVVATVVSTAVSGQAVVDAGSKALAKEAPARQGSYGALLDHPEVRVSALSEEHGVLDLSRTGWRPSVGERVRVVPNHVCVSVNLQDRLVVLDGAEVGEWELEARGRGPYPANVHAALA